MTITDDMVEMYRGAQVGAEQRDAIRDAKIRLPMAVAEFILAKFERDFLEGPRLALLNELRGLVDTIKLEDKS